MSFKIQKFRKETEIFPEIFTNARIFTEVAARMTGFLTDPNFSILGPST